MFDLEKLREKREEILKAELFMLLHDVGKLHAGHQGKFIRKNRIRGYEHYIDILSILRSDLKQWECNLGDSYVTKLSTVIEKHHKKDVSQSSDGVMVVYAQRIDRLDSAWDRDSVVSPPSPRESDEEKKKKWKQLRLTQAFDALVDTFSGFSVYVYKRCKQNRFCLDYDKKELLPIPPTIFLEDALHTVISVVEYAYQTHLLQDYKYRQNLFKVLRLSMRVACGDTRLSVNDISLWDHSISTAILYKALSAWLVGVHPVVKRGSPLSPSDEKSFREKFRPQLLPLRIDGLSYLSDSINIPDLLARRQTLTKAYDTLRDILEWEFPLAGEIYRDENGPVFLTFLKDQKGEENISLSELKLPDENGSAVVSEAYKKSRELDKGLDEYLRRAMSWITIGDLTLPPELQLFTYTQKRSDDKDEKSLGDILREEREKGLWYQADIEKIQKVWNETAQMIEQTDCRRNKKLKVEEICSVCGLRPRGYGAWLVEKSRNKDGWKIHYQQCHDPKQRGSWECHVCKAISRGMCGVCLERREERAKPWAKGIELTSKDRFLQGFPETVWLDEVADKNGRIALIVGYFPLENWLDGTLVESLAMFKQTQAESPPTNRKITVPDENGNPVDVVLGPKPISYSRIRRVWETTRRFWQDVAPTDAPSKEFQDLLQNNEFGLSLKDLWEGPLSLENSLAGKIVGKAGPRLEIRGIPKEIIQNGKLGEFHAYELVLPNNVKIAVLWDPPNKRLITVENLVYTARNLGWNLPKRRENESKKNYEKRLHKEAADFVRNALDDKTVSLNIPPEYGTESETITTFKAQVSEILDSFYTPLIPILAEPQVFMAIVPADKAFEVVKAIKTKYEREMGKVRNRLPLHIGVVYAYRKMPLRAILDAGRRMLKQKWNNKRWEVVCPARKLIEKGDKLPERFHDDQNGQFKEWFEVLIRQGNRTLTWYVPAKMGDGVTDDHWYPYVFLESSSEPTDRSRYYKAISPWNPSHSWLVHVGELEPGDKIYFTPATFDFEFLDTNARRFEITYDKNGKRRNSLTKPYLLDEVEILDKIWKFLTQKQNGKPRLSTTQIFALREIIETKREEWFDEPHNSLADENFKKFCHDLFVNAQWQWGKPDKSKLQWLADMAVRGYFTDAVYLFHHVMKGKVDDHTETR